jgi:hypothetical protein
MYQSLFPKDQETPRTVRVRVVRSTSEHTTVETLDIPAEHWRLVTSRLPERWNVGAEVTITFTPLELEWLQGRRELE